MYENRNEPAYGSDSVELAYARNPHIVAWWTAEQDAVIHHLMAECRWYWSWEVVPALIVITPSSTLDGWRAADPVCGQYDWRNVLMSFARARAQTQGWEAVHLPAPRWLVCPLCEEPFLENSLPYPCARIIGVHRLTVCGPCVARAAWWGDGADTAVDAETIAAFLRNLTATLERIPSQTNGQRPGDLADFPELQRLAVMRIPHDRPPLDQVKTLFGSWFQALVASGVLADDIIRRARGIQCLAADGHVCLSLGEKTIDDLLTRARIPHEREPHYPKSHYRADWQVGTTFVEYYGLAGDPVYDGRRAEKEAVAREHGIAVLGIQPQELMQPATLTQRLHALRCS
jgi:hypothetical protein